MVLGLVIYTANILGVFNDPFEFEGHYGPEINPIRQKVFELVVSKEALAKNLSDSQIRELIPFSTEQNIKKYRDWLVIQARSADQQHGPTLSQLITPELIEEIKKEQKKLQRVGFSKTDLENILHFIDRYKDQKVFHFLRNAPSPFLSLDNILKNRALRKGKAFDLPILGSLEPLTGQNDFELKKNLMKALFTEETFALTHPQEMVKHFLNGLSEDFLKNFFGNQAHNKDLEGLSSSGGQLFFYWMYQALNLHLVSNEEMVRQINKVKEVFAHTLANPHARANAFKEKLMAADCGVLFTQESDTFIPKKLTENDLFLPIEGQNPRDGTFIFLRSDLWQPEYEIIPIKDYEHRGCVNAILATRREDGQKFLFASCHGHSTKPEDGRRQISLVVKKFCELSATHPHLQLIIGMDANTKTEEDVKMFQNHLDSLGLVATNVGPTTVKKRMVTVQHSKVGRSAADQEDYLITLKRERGGKFQFSQVKVGFKEQFPDISLPLPNLDNQSDHYPVGVTIIPFEYSSYAP